MRWREFGGDGGWEALERIGLIRRSRRKNWSFLSFQTSIVALASFACVVESHSRTLTSKENETI